jgi:hypothetical protein
VEFVVDQGLEDVYEFFKEGMRTPKEEEPEMDMTVDLEEEPLVIRSRRKGWGLGKFISRKERKQGRVGSNDSIVHKGIC